MDNQVKFYSSGMLVRLGFAVAVHVDPEILLIDEVLAVGDESFQRRCIDRVRSFQADGRTIVLVTHALDTVVDVCDRAVMLDHGLMHMRRRARRGGARAAPPSAVDHDPSFVAEEGTREVEIDGGELRLRRRRQRHGVAGRRAHDRGRRARRTTPVADLDVVVRRRRRRPRTTPVIDGRTSTTGPRRRRGRRQEARPVPCAARRRGSAASTSSRSASRRVDGRLFHVQTQRYLFQVPEDARVPTRTRGRAPPPTVEDL